MKKFILMLSLFLVFVLSCGKGKEFVVKPLNGAQDLAGAALPDFELKDLNGKKIKNTKIFKNGKKTLFIVAAEWCPHCREEIPEVQRFYDKNKDKVNVVIVFTNSRSSLGKAQAYIKENGYTVPAYYDEDGEILRGFDVQGFPFNLKINGDKVEEELELPVDEDSLTKTFMN